MSKSFRSFRPYAFSNRLMLVLGLCALFASLCAFGTGYLYSRSSVRSELIAAQSEAAVYLLSMEQKTELSPETMAGMVENSELDVSIVNESTLRLTEDQWSVLQSQSILTDTRSLTTLPVTYVRLKDCLLCIRTAAHLNVVAMAVLRIALSIIAYLMVMMLLGTFSMRRIARPISALTAATRKVSDGQFDVRLPENEPGEIGELMCAFNSMAEALGKTSYLQKDFIGSISHEFKTPIASIKGYARLLQMPRLTDDQRHEYVQMIATESDRLSRMSQTLLRLVALEQQAAPVSVNTFRLDEQLREVILGLAPAWESKDIEWQLDLSPVTLVSDEELLRQVWINLIQNAVKFSEKGKPIRISCIQHGEAIVEVQDWGIGMDEDTQARIFDRFYQADTSRSSDGIGLGLSLVKRILDILDGSVKVDSRLGEGSTFRVRLPERLNSFSERRHTA